MARERCRTAQQPDPAHGAGIDRLAEHDHDARIERHVPLARWRVGADDAGPVRDRHSEGQGLGAAPGQLDLHSQRVARLRCDLYRIESSRVHCRRHAVPGARVADGREATSGNSPRLQRDVDHVRARRLADGAGRGARRGHRLWLRDDRRSRPAGAAGAVRPEDRVLVLAPADPGHCQEQGARRRESHGTVSRAPLRPATSNPAQENGCAVAGAASSARCASARARAGSAPAARPS